MQIRKMRQEDVKAAAGINAREFKKDFEFSEEKFGKVLEGSVVAWVIEEEGTVIGYVVAVPRPLAWTPKTSYIKLLGVHEEHRGQGIGTKLMKKCLETLKEKGFENAELLVPVERERALKLYQTFGFTVTDHKLKKNL